jgi:hypothetical protein
MSDVYEMILTVKGHIDRNKGARKLFGSSKTKNGEWRFYPDDTK